MLAGSRSFFVCTAKDTDLARRLAAGDIHPGLPLWVVPPPGAALPARVIAGPWRNGTDMCAFLEEVGSMSPGVRRACCRMTFAGSFVKMARCS
ncbi:MAG: hypothetical protein U5K56_06070 [Halioglobus sp.]|nr:hypothetical protein [Halioglobus sp.]